MDAHGEAAAVVLDGDGAVGVQRDHDVVAEARQRLVHGVVDDFIDEMMQSALIRGADVHARTAANGLQTLEDLNLTFVIVVFTILLIHYSNLICVFQSNGNKILSILLYHFWTRLARAFHPDRKL